MSFVYDHSNERKLTESAMEQERRARKEQIDTALMANVRHNALIRRTLASIVWAICNRRMEEEFRLDGQRRAYAHILGAAVGFLFVRKLADPTWPNVIPFNLLLAYLAVQVAWTLWRSYRVEHAKPTVHDEIDKVLDTLEAAGTPKEKTTDA